ncbi:uncharacterized protein CBL_10198 [Carabus blaptoides fortunei]
MEQPSRDEISARKMAASNHNELLDREIEQQMGVPFVHLDARKPYIPKSRLVHFDLKGAPLRVSYFKRIFPLLKTMGATGILIEYEDMFPYKGILKSIAAKNAYSDQEIKEILSSAEDSKLDVIPLIQTFGHVEFALKRADWVKLREVPNSPQALCPSRNASLDFIKEMVDQVMAAHPKVDYLHIGCDEVFQMGECELCRLESHENLFIRHVRKVAQTIHQKYPKLQLIIWDDMLRHMSQQSMLDAALGDLVEPMVWVYAEDIYRFVQVQVWEKYGAVFRTAWTASAFKGAFGEQLFVPDARRHLENNLRWLEVMSNSNYFFKKGISGIALTGWQRYDHFAVLCELFPAAFPSLALSLLAVSNGYFNQSMRVPLLSVLSCPQHATGGAFVTLESDSHLWDKLGRCMFPGSPFFRLTYRLHVSEIEVNEYLTTVRRNKGWMTEYNARRNYSLPLRVDELTQDLSRVYHGLTSIARSASDTMSDVFDKYTVAEWVEQRIYPYILELEKIQGESNVLKATNTWENRPLKPLKDLQRLGVPLPEEL